MSGPAFVTGASGFVGGALLRGLVKDGREVRALARSTDAAASVQADGGVPVPGDLFDESVLVGGMHGCDTVFHVAGVNAICLRDPNAMFRTNVDGSASVVRAASRAGITRVVFTSSAATIGEPRGVVGTEDAPHRGTFLSAYERSKFLAERRVLELGTELGVDVVCVNPSSVQGPGRTEGSARLLIGLVNARLPVVVETFLSIVDVDDCTKGHLAAETRGRAGERYLLSGASLTTTRADRARAGGRWATPSCRPRASRVGARCGSCGRLGDPADAPGPPVLRRARTDAAARPPVRRLEGHEGAGTDVSADRGDRRSDPRLVHGARADPSPRRRTMTSRFERSSDDGGPVTTETPRPDRNLALELVRVTEAAALAAGRWIGHGDKIAADGAAVDAMRLMIDTVSMHGTVVIGEGEKDEAPMLYNGEEVGDGTGPGVDVAVDPVDGTRLTALGQPNALAVIALAERGSMFFPGAAVYMEKIAAGPEAADAIDITASAAENVRRVAKAKGVRPEEITVTILDRERHAGLITEVREVGARVFLITDGDVAGAIAAATPRSGVDLLLGIGGTPEGVIAAAALKCLGGAIQGRLWPAERR